MLIKIKQTYTLGEDLWVNIVNELNASMKAKSKMNDSEKKRLSELLDKTRRLAMELIQTKNYVWFDRLGDKVVFFELDYVYNGMELSVDKVFRENDEFYILLNKVVDI